LTADGALYVGRVMHQRLKPVRHRLQYRVFSLLVDIDALPTLAQRLRLFSLNRFNLFSLHERDHGAGEGDGLRTHVERQLHAAGLAGGGAIRLLTMPRLLGYAFNPLSVYYCDRPEGGLQAILYEVNNTFGQRHSYLIPVNDAQRRATHIEQHCAKRFHVSPFMDLDMRYVFRVEPPAAGRPGLAVGITVADADGPVLFARIDARRKPLTDGALALAFVTHPLLTLKVVAAIHWEALRLWLKGAPFRRCPPAPAQPVTIVARTEP
jgi:DUF1365 family protein